MSLLKASSVFDKDLMPEKGDYCVYSLLNKKKEIVYVGQSANLRQRIFTHLASSKEFDYIKWCVCEKSEMNNLEAEGIVKAKSPMNKALPKNDLYVGLGCLRREISEKVKEATEGINTVFTAGNNNKYITREDYNKVMSIFESLFDLVSSEFVDAGEDK